MSERATTREIFVAYIRGRPYYFVVRVVGPGIRDIEAGSSIRREAERLLGRQGELKFK